MDTYNPLPPFSQEIEKFVFELTIRTTTGSSHEILQETAPSAVFEEVDHPTPSQKSEDFTESSVVGDINRERLDFEQSLDDRLLKAVHAAIEQRRVQFQHQLQKLEVSCRARLELHQSEQRRKLKQSQETLQLEEIRKLVYYHEYLVGVNHALPSSV